MCVMIYVEAPGEATERLHQVAVARPPELLSLHVEGRGLLRRHQPRLATDGCELLDDDADWDAPTWLMTPDGIVRLSASLAWLLEQLPGPPVVEVSDGSAREEENVVMAEDLLRTVADNQLGTRTRYAVARR